jgi:hypothetical protein
MSERGEREESEWLVELRTKLNMCERGGKLIDWLIEPAAFGKHKFLESGWKMINILVKFITKKYTCERWWKMKNRIIKLITVYNETSETCGEMV